MDKLKNMKQAMYEMFGVGAAPEEKLVSAEEESVVEQVTPTAAQPEKESISKEEKLVEEVPVVQVPAKPAAGATYIAPGTIMEGTLRAVGDVEVAGDFKGDITTEGTVILHSSIEGNLTVSSLALSGCTLVGDVTAVGMVAVSEDSKIRGNVTAKELHCDGQITGDLNVAGHTALDKTACITGNIKTGTLSVTRGAVLKGSVETGNG